MFFAESIAVGICSTKRWYANAMKVEIDWSINVTNYIDFQIEGVIVQKLTLKEEVVFSLFRAVEGVGCSRGNIYPVGA